MKKISFEDAFYAFAVVLGVTVIILKLITLIF
jgi:hypothetical protein